MLFSNEKVFFKKKILFLIQKQLKIIEGIDKATEYNKDYFDKNIMIPVMQEVEKLYSYNSINFRRTYNCLVKLRDGLIVKCKKKVGFKENFQEVLDELLNAGCDKK